MNRHEQHEDGQAARSLILVPFLYNRVSHITLHHIQVDVIYRQYIILCVIIQWS